MAVDMIARMMAMGNGGDSGDSYTKAETDQLLDGKADLENGKVPASQLPSYVDDVLEYASTSAFPETGESGKIYISTDTNKTYRWGGSAYVEISESLALGETASTAYAGNKGKANADAIAAIKDGTTLDSFADVEAALSGKANTADLGTAAAKGVDATPTASSTNLVESAGVASALAPITDELIELVDNGAKNAWSFGDHITMASSGNVIRSAFSLKAGTYIFTCKIASGGTGSTQLKFTEGSPDGDTIATDTWTNTAAGTIVITYTLTSDSTHVVMYTNGSFDYSECMLCTKAAWDISQKFVPYGKTNSELTSEVAALDNVTSNLAAGLVLVAHQASTSSATIISLSYTANENDFTESGNTTARYTGTYLVHCVNWGATGQPYICLLTYSGADPTTLTKTDIVTGFTPTITVTDGQIDISGCARISIYAMR